MKFNVCLVYFVSMTNGWLTWGAAAAGASKYVKTLALLVKWYELRKLKRTEIVYQVLSSALYPHDAASRLALEKIVQWMFQVSSAKSELTLV